MPTVSRNLVRGIGAEFSQTPASSAPPCFNWTDCGRRAALEKAGRSVCRPCAGALSGAEYPLRHPSTELLYADDRQAAEDLDMIEALPEDDGSPRLPDDATLEEALEY
jgi:hypothetical protein